MSSSVSRKETERTKLIQEKCQALLTQMLRDEDNKYCVDCDAKGPRWASWNLGVFLCIRCAGIHRNLGVHISRVKSVNLDTWTPEQVISLQQMGNSRARAVYEAQLPDGFRRPQTDSSLEPFIRAKYEHKKYLAREWVPPSPPKVDWAKEIDEELERQKRKKKASQACSSLGLSVMSVGSDKKPTNSAKSAPLPTPLPKPKPGQSGSSPKTQRISTSSSSIGDSNQSNDLLGLSSPTKPTPHNVSANGPNALGNSNATVQDLHNDSFSCFLSAASGDAGKSAEVNANGQNVTQNSLAKDEEDFFNRCTLTTGSAAGDKDKSGKLTKDSILALYGTAPTSGVVGAHNPHGAQLNFSQPQPMFAATGAFAGIAPAYIGAGGGMPHPQQQQQQFMTPPNSASMYNAPVMTAPTAFTAPGMHLGGAGGFNAQFPGTGATAGPYVQQLSGVSMLPATGAAGGIMATGQPNFIHTNQSLSGTAMPTMMGMPQQPTVMTGMSIPMGGISLGAGSAVFQPPPTASATSNATANLNQQFSNLTIGNVWQ